MMIHITITGYKAGKTYLYEQLGRKGDRATVPTYQANMQLDNGFHFTSFAVSRDASDIVFGISRDVFGKNGECPPSLPKKPYQAVVHGPTNAIPFGIRLYEPEAATDDYHLFGSENIKRRAILIHHGPARSEGCFIIAGGQKGFRRWHQKMWQMIQMNHDGLITVTILPREPSRFTRDLILPG